MKIILALFISILVAGAFFTFEIKNTEIETPALPAGKPEIKFEIARIEEKNALEEIKKELDSVSEAIKNVLPPSPLPPPAPSLVEEPPIKSEEIYKKALSASINIFCYESKKGFYILGSGTVIHPKGYILTNAHLAEHFKEPATDCTLRRGSPAKNFAKAELVWLPDQTLKIGKSSISQNDAAILKITDFTDKSPLPESLPDGKAGFEYFEFDPDYEIKTGEVLYSLSYPSEFLGSDTALKNTNLVFTLGLVEKIVTVDENTSDAEGAYLRGELSAQEGSSGGIFLESGQGKAVGLFVGLTEGETTSERKQFIFLASYIERMIKLEKNQSLKEFLDSL